MRPPYPEISLSVAVRLIDNPAIWQCHAARWDALARGVPFRSFAWLHTWWRYYGPAAPQSEWPRLFLLAVIDEDGAAIGFAPLFLTRSLRTGRVLSLLGTGEVYSDYLSVLAQPGREEHVATALAEWLCTAGEAHWDIIVLEGVDAGDRATMLLLDALEARSRWLFRRRGLDSWRLLLPSSWEGYLAQISKSHRKKIRRLEKDLLASGKVSFHVVEHPAQLPSAFDAFAELHQMRWNSRGQRGCFGSPRFSGFLADVTPRLFSTGQLRLAWLESGGKPVAADYALVGDRVWYGYQGGLDPAYLHLEPGRLGFIATLRSAIEERVVAYDFLRGNEPYKAHFGAEPRPTVAVRVVSPRASARFRNQAWLASQDAKRWLKQKWRGIRSASGAAGSA